MNSSESLTAETDKKLKLVEEANKNTQIQVLGRLAYCGMNEAVDCKLTANLNEFEIDFASGTFSW